MPQLMFGLADFQVVHPTETETITTQINTGTFEPDDKGIARQVFIPTSHQRRKRVPLAGAQIRIKTIDSRGQQIEMDFQTDSNGRALCQVPQSSLPQLPTKADFELVTPKGVRERGNFFAGGNQATPVVEVALQSV